MVILHGSPLCICRCCPTAHLPARVLLPACWQASTGRPALGADALLTVPGDTPFVPPGLAAALAPPPACAASNGRLHHLVALWPITCRDNLRQLLSARGRRDIAHFAGAIGMRRVDFAVAKWDPFLNVNTPEDLALARAIAEAEAMRKTVAIGGLGAIGLKLARALDAGVDGLQLIAVAARDSAKAAANVRGFQAPPQVVPLGPAGRGRHSRGSSTRRGVREDRNRCHRGGSHLRAGVGRRAAAAHASGAPCAGNRRAHRGADRRAARPRRCAGGGRGACGEHHHRNPQAAARSGGRALSGEARHRRERPYCADVCVRGQCIRCRRGLSGQRERRGGTCPGGHRPDLDARRDLG